MAFCEIISASPLRTARGRRRATAKRTERVDQIKIKHCRQIVYDVFLFLSGCLGTQKNNGSKPEPVPECMFPTMYGMQIDKRTSHSEKKEVGIFHNLCNISLRRQD